MRLEFKILWFENQPKDVKTQVEEIEEYLSDAGFIPIVCMEKDASNLEALASTQETFDDFDLVVVDYDLGDPDRNGDWVAQQVRRYFGFTDIIFYSGKKPGQLRELVYKGDIDGVYCFNRPDLAEKLAVHIDQVVRRLSRLEAMRGLAMGVVGKCDDELKRVLLSAYKAGNSASQADLEGQLDSLIERAQKSSTRRYAECRKFSDKLNSRAVSSFSLSRLLQYLIRGDDRCTAERELLVRYEEDVLRPRNVLGHATEERTEAGWVIRPADAPEITAKDFQQLRKNMAIHFSNIRAIGSIVGS